MKLPTNFSMESVKNLKWIKSFKKFTNSNGFTSFVAKAIATIVIWVGALIPTWLYLIARWIAGPDGFWQELAIIVICAIVMGWLQVILAIVAFGLTMAIIVDDTI